MTNIVENNDGLENALRETWDNKEKFHEDTKGLSMLEIVQKIEGKYKAACIHDP